MEGVGHEIPEELSSEITQEIINHLNGIDKIASQCNTICHEILTSISKRVKRVYL